MKRRIHLNLHEAANAYMGIGQYERNMAEALWRSGKYSIDAVSHRVAVDALPFKVRRGFFPKRYFFDRQRWHRFCPFSYNDLVGDFRSEVSVFFPNTMPVMRIRGKSVGVIHDLISFRIPEVLVDECKWYTPASLESYCRMHEYLAHHADKVVTVSEYSRNEIAKEFGLNPADIAVVPNGVEVHRFAPTAENVARDEGIRHKYGLPDRFILYFGTTASYKNVANLIRGYAKLPRAIRHGVSLVVTHGNDVLHAVAANAEVADRVVFLPFIPEEDKPSLYRLASACAFLSRIEGFGIPPLEAMGAGVPVLVSDCTTLPEVVGDAALLVGPDDLDGIAERLEMLLEDSALQEGLKEKGFARARHFTWDRAASKMSEVIDSLMAI